MIPGNEDTAPAAAAVVALAAVALLHGGPASPVTGLDGSPAPTAGRAADSDPVRMERTWPVMGTFLHAVVRAPDSATARAALAAGKDRVFATDSLMSTYRRDSEISRVNRAAGTGRWIRLSPETAAVLDASLRWARATGGAFDPTAGPLAAAWGFHEGDPRVPEPGVRDSAARLVGWDRVEWRPDAREARLPAEGMRLDFGAIAKGHALDAAVEAMREAGAGAGMVDLGGNLRVFGPPPGERSRWRMGIRHPRPGDALLGTVALDSGSVATSGDTEQFFVRDGRRYSHVMDPRTGRPARGVAQVTVVAPSARAADALSTALFVLGPEEGRAWLASRAGAEPGGRGAERLSGVRGELALTGVSVLWVRDPAGHVIGRRHLSCRGGPGATFRVPLTGAGDREPYRCTEEGNGPE